MGHIVSNLASKLIDKIAFTSYQCTLLMGTVPVELDENLCGTVTGHFIHNGETNKTTFRRLHNNSLS